MADFAPFSFDGDKRFPDATEREQGFPCGPADRKLFNGLYHRIEAELREVITFAGITPSDSDLTQVRQAIQAMILLALAGIGDDDTGSGGGGPVIDTSQFVLMGQARSRLPIFPIVQNTTGKMPVSSTGAGNVRIPGTVTFLHRGIFPVQTVQTDLATSASKTYHLRWNPTDGFVLRDLSDNSYNPTVSAETDSRFDSAYDDMLVARVVTNGANIPTITTLVNRDRLAQSGFIVGQNRSDVNGGPNVPDYASFTLDTVYDWARTPRTFDLYTATDWMPGDRDDDNNFNLLPRNGSFVQNQFPQINYTRYGYSGRVLTGAFGGNYTARFSITG